MTTKKKQAILLIHGIGEQRPMETLRGFIRQAWTMNRGAQRQGYEADALWSKPYPLSQDFELRRLTTPTNLAGVRTDFYEFYWAHLMRGTRWRHILAWMRTLLLRSPGSVPSGLKTAYWVLWCLILASAAGLAAYSVLAGQGSIQPAAWLPPWLSWLVGAALVPALGWVATKVVGDAARYLDAAADNVQMRHTIRSAGLQVINALHRDGQYDRIVVVGHSLGSVIGYDILNHAWAQWNAQAGPPSPLLDAALARVGELAPDVTPGDPDSVDQFQQAQHGAARAWASSGRTWRVTDFVTLGSPLAHAPILLARDRADLSAKFAAREYPTCPPMPELQRKDHAISYSFLYSDGERRIPHHAAPFALTRWTNLYFPCRALVGGDLIGGPVAPVFGPGVKDIQVHTARRFGLFAHTLYWSDPRPGDDHIVQLLAALRIAEVFDDGGGGAARTPAGTPPDRPEPGTL